jgi:glycosyltransferase involved in cell wall biosynthesis
MGLRTIRVAKKRGAMTVIERCSSHIEYQRDILKDEYARFGLDIEPVPAGIVERELEEYAEADYIAIPSQFVKRSFLERGVPAEKLIHTPYGVDLMAFRPLRKVDNVFRVINVGAQSIRKGTIYLIQAFAELKLPNAELVLIGPVSEELRPLVAPYEGSFRFLGAVPQEQLIHHYAQADVFALCSVEEGLAYVQPQAMACGLPVICTTNTGGEDIVRDGVDGFVIPIRDVALLKDKISFFYENRQACSEMGNSALERVRSGLSWGDYGQRVVDAYQARLSPKRRIQPPPYTVV